MLNCDLFFKKMNELQANKITSVIHSVNIGAVLSYRPYAAVLAKDLKKFYSIVLPYAVNLENVESWTPEHGSD